jgi:putative FmdB family regulatory protein
MPIYEYQCQKCHHHLEALQKFSDKPLRECPECGKHALKRLMSAPMFRLAGSGWYETDFKSENEQKRNLAGKDEAPAAAENASADKPAAGDKPESKGDSKPESKPESKPDPKPDSKPQPAAASKGRSSTKSTPKPAAPSKPVAKKPAAKKKSVRSR